MRFVFTTSYIIITLLIACNNNAPLKSQVITSEPVASYLKLPPGFKAYVFAENIKRARHLAVTSTGIVYVKTDKALNNYSIWALEDTSQDHHADVLKGFDKHPGTGIAVKGNYLYASSDDAVYRYTLDNAGKVINTGDAVRVAYGLINKYQHASKSITLDNDGNLYVNIGAYSNACQERDRSKGSAGMQPCTILDSAGGIWRFDANGKDQSYDKGQRYATGLRNVVGLDWNSQNQSLFVAQHGRDQLHFLYPDLYDDKANALLPAECVYELFQSANCGWPYTYYDQLQNKNMISPEYGGDGKKFTDEYLAPVIAYPGHLAPNGLLFYTGNSFPADYRNGMFIAFHGSWNRAPELQAGYFVVFTPFKNGKPSADWQVFADNFAEGTNITSPAQAKHRPCGLAQGPDGSLYVSDDAGGTIYKIVYEGK